MNENLFRVISSRPVHASKRSLGLSNFLYALLRLIARGLMMREGDDNSALYAPARQHDCRNKASGRAMGTYAYGEYRRHARFPRIKRCAPRAAVTTQMSRNDGCPLICSCYDIASIRFERDDTRKYFCSSMHHKSNIALYRKAQLSRNGITASTFTI